MLWPNSAGAPTMLGNKYPMGNYLCRGFQMAAISSSFEIKFDAGSRCIVMVMSLSAKTRSSWAFAILG